eukprot:maker-scaffold_3-snap-gene-15.27-mRNA-1 protein AED:0.00 eAED:0.00 QI:250/1/1/1/1/1/3/115/376
MYKGFTLPLRVLVESTSFSHPENYIHRDNNQYCRAASTDPNGAWMKAGVGGESNTIDLKLKLVDANNAAVDSSDIIPIKVRLWTCTKDYKFVELLEEINGATPMDRAGHRRLTYLVVSGKTPSKLCINLNGRGKLSFRVVKTSQQTRWSKFSLEVLPDLSGEGAKFSSLFSEFVTSVGDIYRPQTSHSMPVEVMSKVNRLAEKRKNGSDLVQAQHHLSEAIMHIKTELTSSNSVEDGFDRSKILVDLLSKTDILRRTIFSLQYQRSGIGTDLAHPPPSMYQTYTVSNSISQQLPSAVVLPSQELKLEDPSFTGTMSYSSQGQGFFSGSGYLGHQNQLVNEGFGSSMQPEPRDDSEVYNLAHINKRFKISRPASHYG